MPGFARSARAGLAAVCVATACTGSGRVAGHVTQLEAGPLAGARVTVDGLKTHQQIVTDASGAFEVG
jgi:hypothetical protein